MGGDQALRDFAQALARAQANSDLIRAKLVSNNQEACDLKSAGMLNASPWFKNDKYLYLVFPADEEGKRKRQYVGINSKKIDKCIAAIGRARRYSGIQKENNEIVSRLILARQHIDSLNQLFSAEASLLTRF